MDVYDWRIQKRLIRIVHPSPPQRCALPNDASRLPSSDPQNKGFADLRGGGNASNEAALA